jgi:hypothetical protein
VSRLTPAELRAAQEKDRRMRREERDRGCRYGLDPFVELH